MQSSAVRKIGRTTKSAPQRQKVKIYQFRQPSTKKFGKRGSQVPVPQQLRIVEKYLQGKSIRKIAEEEDRARQTITRVVRAPEVESYIQGLREQLIGLGDDMVKSIRFALQNEVDGRLAYGMLKELGVLRIVSQTQTSATVSTEDEHQRLVQEWTRKLDRA